MIGDRVKMRLEQLGLNQSELARKVGLTQPAINALIRGSSRTSLHLHRIAAALRTTTAFLEGGTDDPDEGAPAPEPTPVLNHIMMPVALPSENALARMFEGLLEVTDRSASTAELARELAQLLPSGLLQLRGRLSELTPMVPPRRAEVAEAHASEDLERR